jgi:hypothetical protein
MDFAFITPNVGDVTEVQAGTGISVADGTGPPIVTYTVELHLSHKVIYSWNCFRHTRPA